MRKFVLSLGLIAGAAVLLLVLADVLFTRKSDEQGVLAKNLSLIESEPASTAPAGPQKDARPETGGIRAPKELDLGESKSAYLEEADPLAAGDAGDREPLSTPVLSKRSLLFLSAQKDAIITPVRTGMRRQKIASRMIGGCQESKYDRLISDGIKAKRLSQPIKGAGMFDNPFSTWKKPAISELANFLLFEPNLSNVPKDPDELNKVLPVLRPNFQVNQSQQDNFRATWIGHATTLIQVNGVNILTDPVFSERASFTQLVGAKRIRPPACQISELPPIHIVLISHNHFDHLDSNSVRQLNDRFGNQCKWIVPLGIGEFLESMRVNNYVELDWWQKDCYSMEHMRANSMQQALSQSFTKAYLKQEPTSVRSEPEGEFSGLQVYLTPAQHWSRRWINDYNKSLWGSFVIINRQGSKFFFAGDTGYCVAFKEIGQIFGPFKGAAIPIGAYHPRDFLKYPHVDPEHAVKIHQDIGSEKSFAIHHSTFILSNEPYREPAQLLSETIANLTSQGLHPKPFFDVKHGQSVEF